MQLDAAQIALCWKQAVHVAPPLSSPVGAPAPRAPPSRRNVAVVSDARYVLTVTAAPRLGPMYATDRCQTSDRRQTASSLNAPAY